MEGVFGSGGSLVRIEERFTIAEPSDEVPRLHLAHLTTSDGGDALEVPVAVQEGEPPQPGRGGHH